MVKESFEWDFRKDILNRRKHGVSFEYAQYAFTDKNRIILYGLSHGAREHRYFCYGRIGSEILTVRFTYRGVVVRIFGAGYWRKGKRIYEQEN